MAINKVVYDSRILMDLTNDTVTEAALLKGTTAHNKAGNQITGSVSFQHYYTGTTEPASNLGVEGDLYFKKVQ